jgi:hypothetical protein
MAEAFAGWWKRNRFKSNHSSALAMKSLPCSGGRGGGETKPSYSQGWLINCHRFVTWLKAEFRKLACKWTKNRADFRPPCFAINLWLKMLTAGAGDKIAGSSLVSW